LGGDVITDVLVVGYGFAGGVAALVAADRGAQIMLIEKMPFPGGLSVTSGGGLAVAGDEEKMFQYLRRTNLNTTWNGWPPGKIRSRLSRAERR
jgi:succinate dehydrogenase/fumarate reductase flavoprotein subunit